MGKNQIKIANLICLFVSFFLAVRVCVCACVCVCALIWIWITVAAKNFYIWFIILMCGVREEKASNNLTDGHNSNFSCSLYYISLGYNNICQYLRMKSDDMWKMCTETAWPTFLDWLTRWKACVDTTWQKRYLKHSEYLLPFLK